MKTWFKEEIAVATSLLRRPGAGMALLGYLIARMSLQADVYVPDWLAGTPLTLAVFWLGEAMIAFGAAWFIMPEIKGLFVPTRAPSPEPVRSDPPVHGDAKPV